MQSQLLCHDYQSLISGDNNNGATLGVTEVLVINISLIFNKFSFISLSSIDIDHPFFELKVEFFKACDWFPVDIKI